LLRAKVYELGGYVELTTDKKQLAGATGGRT
jgi:hypothetical protein